MKEVDTEYTQSDSILTKFQTGKTKQCIFEYECIEGKTGNSTRNRIAIASAGGKEIQLCTKEASNSEQCSIT